MFKLIECKNPSLRQAIVDKRRYNNLSDLKDVVINGKRYCIWCCENELKSRVQRYCSSKCKTHAWLNFGPQGRDGVAWLLFRQRFKCAICDYSWKETIRDIFNHCKKYNMLVTWFKIGRNLNGLDYPEPEERTINYRGVRHHRGVQVDHIIPISEGGDTYGFDNCQAVCVQCHLVKSSNEKRRAYEKVRYFTASFTYFFSRIFNW